MLIDYLRLSPTCNLNYLEYKSIVENERASLDQREAQASYFMVGMENSAPSRRLAEGQR